MEASLCSCCRSFVSSFDTVTSGAVVVDSTTAAAAAAVVVADDRSFREGGNRNFFERVTVVFLVGPLGGNGNLKGDSFCPYF